MKRSNLKNNMSKKQQGFTLVELLIAVTLATGLFLIAIIVVPLIRDNNASSNLTQQVTTFNSVLSTSCYNGDCSSVTTANVLASQLLKEYHNSDDTAINTVSGVPIVFASGDVGSGTDNAISQIHADIRDRVCNISVKNLWQIASLINVNGVPVKDSISESLDEAAINTNCAASDNSVEIITRA